MFFTLSARWSVPAATSEHARGSATKRDRTNSCLVEEEEEEECHGSRHGSRHQEGSLKRTARPSSTRVYHEEDVKKSLDCVAAASSQAVLLSKRVLPGILKDVLRDEKKQLLNVLSAHQGAVSQLVTVATHQYDTYACPFDYCTYPRASSLRLLALAVAGSAQAFDTLMGHAELSAFYLMLGVEVNIARTEVDRCEEDGKACADAEAEAEAEADADTAPVSSAASTSTSTSTASSAVLQDTAGPKRLVFRNTLSAQDVCVDALMTQPAPWLTPGLANGVTALWLLLAIAQYSPPQLRVVMAQCPDILPACTSIVMAASQPECFRQTRGSGIYGVAWRVMQCAVECDDSFLQLNTRSVVAVLLRNVFISTDELAFLVARTVYAVTQSRACAVLDSYECCKLVQLLVVLLPANDNDNDNDSAAALTLQRLVIASMHQLVTVAPEVAHISMEPGVAKVLTRIICSECFGVDEEALTCARQTLEIYSASSEFLSKKRNALALPAVVGLANAALNALETCLDTPNVVLQTVPFLHNVFAKCMESAAVAAGTGIVMPPGLPAHAVVILRTYCVYEEDTCHCQTVYNAAYIVGLLGSYTALVGLQATLPALLEIGSGEITGSTLLTDEQVARCEKNTREVREMALTAVASILSNATYTRFADESMCDSIFGLATEVFVSHSHIVRATRGVVPSDLHTHDDICAKAISCLTHVIENVEDNERDLFISELLEDDQFMHMLHIMAHPEYRCVPLQYSDFFFELLGILVPMTQIAAGRELAMVAYLTALARPSDLDDKLSLCCVCLEPIAEAASPCFFNLYTHSVCRHDYHPQCLGKWLAMQDSCPSCRMPVLNIA